MDRASQPARTGLTDRLAPDIARINFYRFCQLLEQSQQNAPLGSTDSPATDAVRFRPHPGMGFPVSELKTLNVTRAIPTRPHGAHHLSRPVRRGFAAAHRLSGLHYPAS